MTTGSNEINKDSEREILQQSPFYSNNVELDSSIDRMRDNLALMLFNTKNVCLAGESEHYEFFVFLFILVVLLEIIQSKTLTIESRRDLCKVVYYSMKAIKDNSIDSQRARKNSKKNV